mgnify:CR=1 FL=1
MNKLRDIILSFLAFVMIVGFTLVIISPESIFFIKKNPTSAFKGIEATFESYDAYGNIGESIDIQTIKIQRNRRFSNNSDSLLSPVIRITINGDEIHHMGAPLIISDKSIKRINENQINKNTSNKNQLLLIKDVYGNPLSLFEGDKITVHTTFVPHSILFLIDKKPVFAHKSNYTIYSTSFFK